MYLYKSTYNNNIESNFPRNARLMQEVQNEGQKKIRNFNDNKNIKVEKNCLKSKTKAFIKTMITKIMAIKNPKKLKLIIIFENPLAANQNGNSKFIKSNLQFIRFKPCIRFFYLLLLHFTIERSVLRN